MERIAIGTSGLSCWALLSACTRTGIDDLSELYVEFFGKSGSTSWWFGFDEATQNERLTALALFYICEGEIG